MNLSDVVGYAAAILATSAFLPQAIKTLRSRRTQDISLGMYVLLCGGVALWLIYGLMLGAMPIIAANAVTLVLSTTILLMKLRNG